MAVTFRQSGNGGGSTGTSNRTLLVTAAISDDLLFVFLNMSANSNDAPVVTDDHADGLGTYTLLDALTWGNLTPSTCRGSVHVRNRLLGSTDTSFTITATTGSNTSGVIGWIAVQGALRAGASAVRSQGGQESIATGNTPAPALNRAALTANMTMAAVFSEDTTTTEASGWTERYDSSQSSPAITLETCTRDSGFTGTTITFGAACTSTTFASFALEVDGTSQVLDEDQPVRGQWPNADTVTVFS